jgi:hypothetical protein
MKRILLASILTLACIGAGTPALAHGHGHHRGNHQGNCADRDCNGNHGKAAMKKQRGKQNQCTGEIGDNDRARKREISRDSKNNALSA